MFWRDFCKEKRKSKNNINIIEKNRLIFNIFLLFIYKKQKKKTKMDERKNYKSRRKVCLYNIEMTIFCNYFHTHKIQI